MRDQMLESTVGRRILRERPIINTRTIDFDKLKQTCAPGTFGYTYIHWLEDQGFTPDTRCYVKYVDDIPEPAPVITAVLPDASNGGHLLKIAAMSNRSLKENDVCTIIYSQQ